MGNGVTGLTGLTGFGGILTGHLFNNVPGRVNLEPYTSLALVNRFVGADTTLARLVIRCMVVYAFAALAVLIREKNVKEPWVDFTMILTGVVVNVLVVVYVPEVNRVWPAVSVCVSTNLTASMSPPRMELVNLDWD